jgi:hypothetical protein
MLSTHFPFGPVTKPAPTDLSDSLDVRLVVAGRLSPTAVGIRRDRAEIAAVLERARQSRPEARTHLKRIAR